jgi:hypothetical protein
VEEVKVDKEKLRKKSRIITVMLYISLFCMFCILLFVIFKKDDGGCNCSSQNGTVKEVNVKELKTKLEELNKKARELVNIRIDKTEFETKAKDIFTKEMVDKLLTYYIEDGFNGVCISMAACNVDGGYMTDDADRGHFFLEINKINADTIEATGYYGEITTSEERVGQIIDNLTKQDITYKLEDGNWKIANFDIKAYN